MIQARETRNLAPYTAKNTLDFIQNKFVKNNANTTHIAWTKILLHTRIIGQAIYQWQASFDPLIRCPWLTSPNLGTNPGVLDPLLSFAFPLKDDLLPFPLDFPFPFEDDLPLPLLLVGLPFALEV